jgi:preprotein translocase subunit SecE
MTFINRIPKYFSEVWKELNKVTWPSRKDVINHTLIVIVSSIVAVLIVTAIDQGLSSLISYIISLKQ